jgi:phage gpG-like protein
MSVKFTSHKKEVLDELQTKINRALEICGGEAEKHIKTNLTRNRSVRSNTLRSSIAHEQLDDRTEIIGTNVKYAPYVELGHHQQPGRYVPAIKRRLVKSWVPGKPYMRPALDNNKEQYRKIIKTELEG